MITKFLSATLCFASLSSICQATSYTYTRPATTGRSFTHVVKDYEALYSHGVLTTADHIRWDIIGKRSQQIVEETWSPHDRIIMLSHVACCSKARFWLYNVSKSNFAYANLCSDQQLNSIPFKIANIHPTEHGAVIHVRDRYEYNTMRTYEVHHNNKKTAMDKIKGWQEGDQVTFGLIKGAPKGRPNCFVYNFRTANKEDALELR